MSIGIAAASPWPARAAHFSAAIFTGASGSINVTYGWAKGSDIAGSLTWAAVAAAVAIIFALCWPALIRSLEAKRWSAALMALVALLLAGGYRVTAALGSAAGGRANATIVAAATADDRKRSQDAYNAAKSSLEALPSSRPVAEVEALVAGAKPVCRIVVRIGYRDTICTPPPALMAELGRAKRRAELETTMAKASEELTRIGPAKQANSDARALARYLQAFGMNTTAEHLNDLLVLLAVLMVECGGGLSLALGMALGAPSAGSTATGTENQCAEPDYCRTRQENAVATHPNTHAEQPEHPRRITVRPPSSVVEWLVQQGGRAKTSRRRLATALGRSPTAVHEELRRLAERGAITMAAGPRGTVLALRPN